MKQIGLHWADWTVVAVYLLFAFGVGVYMKRKADAGVQSYFLAGRNLPWWWAGASIAATTFAADTPLAVVGLVADRGMSGNWLWMSWIGVHAAVVVYFGQRWRRAHIVTDAELVRLRYSGRPASALRGLRALLYGVVFNGIVLGWVLAAMVKITTPFFDWQAWAPGLMSSLGTIWPENSALGTPAEGITVLVLLVIVGAYSSLGGIRGVIFTDLVQLTIALAASFWLAIAAWGEIGGGAGLRSSLDELYGANHNYLDLLPSASEGWLSTLEIGAFGFGLYLIVQSYSNVPADGGGYIMQRLSTAKDDDHARRASMLFVGLQYLVRLWPWLMTALAAIVLIPLGGGGDLVSPAVAQEVANDRELAYPVLMAKLLPPVVLGLLLTSMLAAFMSTVDTHLNWGSSYIVNDVLLRLRPEASDRMRITVARISVLCFALMGATVCMQVERIDQAWRWVALIGASIGVPTVLRWVWWRINAVSEIVAVFAGFGTAAYLMFSTDVPYELRLVYVSAASAVGMLFGVALGPKTDPDTVSEFVKKVRPSGLWPDRSLARGWAQLGTEVLRLLLLVTGILGTIAAVHQALFLGSWLWLLAGLGGLGIAAIGALTPRVTKLAVGTN